MISSSDINKPDKTVSNKFGISAKQIIFYHNSRLHGPCYIFRMKSPLSRKHALEGPCPFESGHYCVHASFTQSPLLMTHLSQSNELYSPVTSHPLFTVDPVHHTKTLRGSIHHSTQLIWLVVGPNDAAQPP